MSDMKFTDLGLSEPVLRALEEVGYETPTPIQGLIIPAMLAGRDVIGQAQTGTGKTGAFALPVLTRIDLARKDPQVLVLAPTRELAIQVAEAFQRYASKIPGFHVLPIYGGAGYGGQLRQLQRVVHVVVGTPGRLCDHLRRKTLDISALTTLVIDEADEMLRMGFIEEVEWILEHTPAQRQVALFSATMPKPIRVIAQRYLKEPEEITIKGRTATASTIRQRYWMVSGLHKLDALTRILEGEDFDAMLVFVRTKNATDDLAKRLEARGFSAAPLSGDIAQNKREETVERLRKGDLDILVATDVAARGLDVQRISHVINYDIPHDTESYIHRIGRTGRAGRMGEAILFVSPRERSMLLAIEKATRQPIELMQLPTTEHINDQRLARFKQRITDALAIEEGREFYTSLLEQYRDEHNVPAIEIAAALARLIQGDEPLLLPREERRPPVPPARPAAHLGHVPGRPAPRPPAPAPAARSAARPSPADDKLRRPTPKGPTAAETGWDGDADIPFDKYILDVGESHGVKHGQIIGAIANEAGLEGRFIRKLRIQAEQSTVELPAGMPADIFRRLAKVRVAGRPLKLKIASSSFRVPGDFERKPRKSPAGPKSFKPTGPKRPSAKPKRG